MKVRLFGIPHLGQEDKPYNNPKVKMYFILVTHPDRWGRPLSTAECLAGTGLELDKFGIMAGRPMVSLPIAALLIQHNS